MKTEHLQQTWMFCLIVLEIILSFIIIMKVKYTEIDWKAYMEEVQFYWDGEYDYTKISGSTGPLVYPAGFLYFFSVLKWLTNNGNNILHAQYIFGFIYIINLFIVMKLYQIANIPGVLMITLVLSKRIHSIYMLRMFNDCVAVLIGYTSLYLFAKQQWKIGCVIYSLSVSIKMNMLLWAPGILLILLIGTNGITDTIVCLTICALVQIIVGIPFLSTYPYEYLTKSFEIGRVFMFQWTVNYKFLPEEIFTSKIFSGFLLFCTVIGYIVFYQKWFKELLFDLNKVSHIKSKSLPDLIGLGRKRSLSPTFIISCVFQSNFIGIVFARSLHYQFYSWYFHMIPFILYYHSIYSRWMIIPIMVLIEICYNIYPANPISSGVLQLCHGVILISMYLSPSVKAFTNKDKQMV